MIFRRLIANTLATLALLAASAAAQVLQPTQYSLPTRQDSANTVPDRIDAQVRENDAGRFGIVHSEVMERLYDVSGPVHHGNG